MNEKPLLQARYGVLSNAIAFVAISCACAAALAEPPQISRALSVMMQVATQYEERQRDGKENPLYFSDRAPSADNPKLLFFADHPQLLAHFSTLPADQRAAGLWIKRMARPLWTKLDDERIAALTNAAMLANLALFLCEPAPGKKGSWLVTWDCAKVSPQLDGSVVSCEAIESRTSPPLWACKERNT